MHIFGARCSHCLHYETLLQDFWLYISNFLIVRVGMGVVLGVVFCEESTRSDCCPRCDERGDAAYHRPDDGSPGGAVWAIPVCAWSI